MGCALALNPPMNPERASNKDPRVVEALSSLSPVERWLWGAVVRRNLTRARTRLSRFIPKYGLKAATQIVIGEMWLLAAMVSFFAFFVLEGSSSELIHAGARVLEIIWVMCLLFAGFRGLTSFRSIQKHRGDRTDDGGNQARDSPSWFSSDMVHAEGRPYCPRVARRC